MFILLARRAADELRRPARFNEQAEHGGPSQPCRLAARNVLFEQRHNNGITAKNIILYKKFDAIPNPGFMKPSIEGRRRFLCFLKAAISMKLAK